MHIYISTLMQVITMTSFGDRNIGEYCCIITKFRISVLGLVNNHETMIIVPSWSHDNDAVKILTLGTCSYIII